MKDLQMVSLRFLTTAFCGLLLAFSVIPVHADERGGLGEFAEHDHQPIRVQSRPVIERLPVKVIEPVDLKISAAGQIFVADKAAEVVFRIDPDGTVNLAVERLSNIRRIQLDAAGSLYVLTAVPGESSIYQITPAGTQIRLCSVPATCGAFVRDSVGTQFVSVSDSGRILSISEEGLSSELSQLSGTVVDLVLNAADQLEALMADGQVLHVDHSGAANFSGFAPRGALRLTSLTDGTLMALSPTIGGQSQIVDISRTAAPPGEFRLIAKIPVGTQAAGFDSLGNLCLANPDLRAVTKVTSRFIIPCPHCGRPTHMIFSIDREPIQNQVSGKF